jgi:hypothetical protein
MREKAGAFILLSLNFFIPVIQFAKNFLGGCSADTTW